MPYGIIKVDTVTFTDASSDKSVSISGLVKNPTFSGNVTATGTISGATIQGGTLVSGATVTGSAGQFTTLTAGTVTLTSGVFASGTAAAPSISVGTTTNGFYSPGTNQVAISTSGTGRLTITSDGKVGIAKTPGVVLDVEGPVRSTQGTIDARLQAGASGAAAVGTYSNDPLLIVVNGTERARFDSSGNMALGSSTAAGYAFLINKALTGALSSYGIVHQGTVQSDATSNASYFTTAVSTQAATFTVGNIYHYQATQGAIGVGSTVTNQIGFAVGASLTGATNNYGFFSNIPSGTGRWNFYAANTANNYFAGNVGIGTVSPGTVFEAAFTAGTGTPRVRLDQVSDNPYVELQRYSGTISQYVATRLRSSGSTAGLVFERASSAAIGSQTFVESARIDNSGRLLVGTSTARNNFFNATGYAPTLQIESSVETNRFISCTSSSADVAGGGLVLAKQRSGAVGGNTIVQINDELGQLAFQGSDGSEFVAGALIRCEVDATPGANDMPGRLVFSTTADGASSPTERMRITSAGNILVGRSYSVGEKIGIGGGTSTYSTGTSAVGIYDDTVVSSAQTTSYTSFQTYPGTATAAFTLANLTHYNANQGVLGAGSSITNQYGFVAQGGLTGATNNYGFYAGIASGTGRWNFYAAGTANNYFAGNVGIGNTAPSNPLVIQKDQNAVTLAQIVNSDTGSTAASGVQFLCGTKGMNLLLNGNGSYAGISGISGTTTIYNDFDTHVWRTISGTTKLISDSSGRLLVGTSSVRAVGEGFQSANSSNLIIEQSGSTGLTPITCALNRDDANGPRIVLGKSRGTTVGSSTIVQNGDGLGDIIFAGADGTDLDTQAAKIFAQVDGTPGTNDMPGRLVFSTTADGASSPTERMRIDNAGRVSIGSAGTNSLVSLYNRRDLTGGAQAWGYYANGIVQSDVTGSAIYYGTSSSTQATAFTCSNLIHYACGGGSAGAGSTITNQYGFYVESVLTGATNNYGFYSNIPSGTGRWNFYASNTADSYFASNNFIFANGGTERARVDSSGRLLVGTSSSITAVTFPAQVQTNSFYSYSASLFSADASGSNFFFLKSRNATTGSHTVVQANDVLGQTQYAGSDGTAFITGAAISAAVDGTPGTNDMPGRIVLATTADGSSSPTEQWRINNTGTVIYNQPAPAAVNTTATLTVANLTAKIITSTTAAAVTMTLPLGTDMDTGFSGLYTNMAFEWYVINTGATNAVTVQANTGHTIVGSATVAASNSGKFLSRRTAANTWVTYRLSS